MCFLIKNTYSLQPSPMPSPCRCTSPFFDVFFIFKKPNCCNPSPCSHPAAAPVPVLMWFLFKKYLVVATLPHALTGPLRQSLCLHGNPPYGPTPVSPTKTRHAISLSMHTATGGRGAVKACICGAPGGGHGKARVFIKAFIH
jgi:hypothetical protein